jgi:hypothetical protein
LHSSSNGFQSISTYNELLQIFAITLLDSDRATSLAHLHLFLLSVSSPVGASADDHLHGLGHIHGGRGRLQLFDLLLSVLVLSELLELVDGFARLIVLGVVIKVREHVVLLARHDVLVLEETVEELLKGRHARIQEVFFLRAENLFLGELRQLIENMHRETLLDQRLEGTHARVAILEVQRKTTWHVHLN